MENNFDGKGLLIVLQELLESNRGADSEDCLKSGQQLNTKTFVLMDRDRNNGRLNPHRTLSLYSFKDIPTKTRGTIFSPIVTGNDGLRFIVEKSLEYIYELEKELLIAKDRNKYKNE